MKDFEKEDLESLKASVDKFTSKYGLEVYAIPPLLGSTYYVPVCIFNGRLTPFESIVKFLKENQKKRLVEIARILNRSLSNIWQTYRNSKRRHPESLKYYPSRYDIPLTDLYSERLSILEMICCYLKDAHNLRFSTIAKLIQRNPRTIWTTYNRAQLKKV